MLQEFGKTVEPHLERLYRESLISLDLSKGRQIIAANGKVVDDIAVKEAKEKVIQFVQENKAKELKEYLYEIGNRYGNDFQSDLKKTIEVSIDNIYEGRRSPEIYDMLGGHTIYDLFDGKIDTKHVGKTVQQLKARFEIEPDIPYSSSFTNLERAGKAQREFIKHYEKEISQWLKDPSNNKPFTRVLDIRQDLGIVVKRGNHAVKTGSKVEATLAKNGTEQGWYIVTSYPTL